MEEEKPKYEITCFISSPFAGRFKDIHQVLSENVSKRVEEITKEDIRFRHVFKLIWNRLDNAPFIAQNIQKNVLSSIKKSHLLVADISSQYVQIEKSNINESDTKPKPKPKPKVESPNPSVMHEIGFATALGIPIFLIGQRGSSEHLPANLKGFLVSEYDKEELVKTDSNYTKEFSNNLAETITNVIDKAGAPLTPGDFPVEGYRLRRTVDLPYLIRNSKYRVYVLTTNIEYVLERLLEAIKYALDLNISKHPDSKEPLNKSFKVDILTMDPESIVTNARAKQLSVNVAKFRDILRESLDKIKQFSNEYPNNVEIATYVSLPTLIMFVIDDMIVCSVPFPSQQSRLVPHFVIAHDDVTIQQFISYFFSVKSQAGREILL
jgi:hypothetical protein